MIAVSEWSKCSKPCAGGLKERRVECKQIMAQEHKVEWPASMCPSNTPPDKKPCNGKACAPEYQKPPIPGNQLDLHLSKSEAKFAIPQTGFCSVYI
ncbi:hypothetical protein pipiens_016536 [Culex pipiens pipiens]|uniref:Uncharacterized protein n=1 Tax=Culex pipiens pipiens TaxID=38569 RepID=A0ABD1CKV6_CULPP